MLDPRLVPGAPAFWMQTTGEMLLTVRRCSLACTWMLAQGSCSACGLLYFAAVRGGRTATPDCNPGFGQSSHLTRCLRIAVIGTGRR